MALDDPTREAAIFLAWCAVVGTALGYMVDRALAIAEWRRNRGQA